MKRFIYLVSMLFSTGLYSQSLYERWVQGLERSLRIQQTKAPTEADKEAFQRELEFLSDTLSYGLVNAFLETTPGYWQQDTILMIFKENTSEFRESWIYLLKKDSCILYQFDSMDWVAVKSYVGDQTALLQQLDACLIPKACELKDCSDIDDWAFTIGDRPIIVSKVVSGQFEVRFLPSFCVEHIRCMRLIWSR